MHSVTPLVTSQVPHLPLEDMGFHHISTEVFYTQSSSNYTVCDAGGEDHACAVRGFRLAFALEDAIEFHVFAPLEALPCV
jgi:hypothetical protein